MKRFLPKPAFFTFVFLIANLFIASVCLGQTVTLDQADLDYAPGETVYITGTGWYPNETINLQVDHLTEPIPDHGTPDPHLPWTVVADSSGNFSASWDVTEYELGANLLLNADGLLSGYTYEVFFTDASSTTIAITGGTNPTCSGSSVTFTATKMGGGCDPSFQWRKNGIDIVGATSSLYTTTTLANGDVITVYQSVGANGCSAALSTNSITMTVNSGIPSIPEAINPSTNTCSGTGRIFSISPVSGATSYTWSVTGTGWSVTAGQGTTSATITIGSGVGTVSVTASNACGTSSASTTGNITPTAAPATPGEITQPTNKCAGSIGNIFSIANVSGATSYTWSVTGTGWSVTAGQGTTSATITIGSGVGTVSVTATNICGTSAASTTGGITPTALPTANLTPNSASICQGENVILNVALTGSGTISGTLSDGTPFSGVAGNISIIKTPTADITYTIAALTNGTCTGTFSGSTVVTIKGKYTSDAGIDKTICPGSLVSLDGVITGSSPTLLWTSSGTGSFSDTSSLTPTYTPSAVDVVAGSVILSLKVSGAGACEAIDSMILSIGDVIAPVATAKNITVQLDATGNATIAENAVNDGSSDACGGLTYDTDITSFNCSNVGANPVVLTVTDNNGNVSTTTATVTVKDEVAPVAIAQNVEVQLDNTGNGSATVALVNNGSSDACGIASLTLSKTAFTCADVGPNTVTLTVTDNNRNVSTTTATVTVKDEVAPVAIAQNVEVQLNNTGNGTTTAALVNNGSSDACGIASLSLSKTAFTCADIASNPNTVTLTVTDNNGNVSATTATVTVKDEVPPVAITQNVEVQLDNTGNGLTTAALVNNGSSDTCGIASLTLSKTAFTCADIASNPNTVTLTVTDNNGNVSTTTATVTVKDEVAPVAIAQNVEVQLDNTGNGSTTAALVNNGSSDACGIASLTLSKTAFTCANVGSNTVTLTVTDNNGNVSTAPATVTVKDNTAPTIVCPANIVLSACQPTTTWSIPSVSDNCSGVMVVKTAGPASGSTFAPGTTTTITYTATDVAGNTTSCSFTVTRTATLVASSEATAILCNGDNSTVTVSAVGGKAPYTGTGTFTRTAGTYSFTVTDYDGCSAIASITIAQPSAVTAVFETDNSYMYFGYSGDQSAKISVTPSGGLSPASGYKVKIYMTRPIKCNFINEAGDEKWIAPSGAGINTENNLCPANPGLQTLLPSTTWDSVAAGATVFLNVILMQDATFTVEVTDINNCVYTSSYLNNGSPITLTSPGGRIDAEDSRCFAGKSGVEKVTICHKTGSTKNPCIEICVDQSAVQEHVNHGDFLGKCTSTCSPPGANAKIPHADKMLVETTDTEPVEFAVKVFPNPSYNQFTLILEGGSTEKIEVQVYDMLARKVKSIEKNNNQPIVFGEEFPAGEYIVLVRQGENAKTVNLIKK